MKTNLDDPPLVSRSPLFSETDSERARRKKERSLKKLAEVLETPERTFPLVATRIFAPLPERRFGVLDTGYPSYEHLFLKSPIQKLNVRPFHCLHDFENINAFGDIVVGSYDDDRSTFQCLQRNLDHNASVYIHFRGCLQSCCVVNCISSLRLSKKAFRELSHGLGFFIAYNDVLKLVRFDINF